MLDQAESLANTFRANTGLLRRLTEGVTHAESLRTRGERVNCTNWVLGHVISGRHKAPVLLGFEGFWDETRMSIYQTGSTAIIADGQAVPFEILIRELERSLQALEAAFETASTELLNSVKETDRGEKPLQEHIEGLGWRETFHVGQVDILPAYAHEIK
jgi:hypothetical protein